MDYTVHLPTFEGPLDLLLHLIKQSDINIHDISINDITIQYLDYINRMEELNLDVASEYLVMAAELVEIKSKLLLPHDEEDELEEDPREELIRRLLEYEHYKESTKTLKKLEEIRKEVFTKEPSDLLEFSEVNNSIDHGVTLTDLFEAFSNLLTDKEIKKPLNTKITNKEHSVTIRCNQIRDILRKKKTIKFQDLFEEMTKEYLVVTFLAILNLSQKQEIEITQDKNFANILLKSKEGTSWKLSLKDYYL